MKLLEIQRVSDNLFIVKLEKRKLFNKVVKETNVYIQYGFIYYSSNGKLLPLSLSYTISNCIKQLKGFEVLKIK